MCLRTQAAERDKTGRVLVVSQKNERGLCRREMTMATRPERDEEAGRARTAERDEEAGRARTAERDEEAGRARTAERDEEAGRARTAERDEEPTEEERDEEA